LRARDRSHASGRRLRRTIPAVMPGRRRDAPDDAVDAYMTRAKAYATRAASGSSEVATVEDSSVRTSFIQEAQELARKSGRSQGSGTPASAARHKFGERGYPRARSSASIGGSVVSEVQTPSAADELRSWLQQKVAGTLHFASAPSKASFEASSRTSYEEDLEHAKALRASRSAKSGAGSEVGEVGLGARPRSAGSEAASSVGRSGEANVRAQEAGAFVFECFSTVLKDVGDTGSACDESRPPSSFMEERERVKTGKVKADGTNSEASSRPPSSFLADRERVMRGDVDEVRGSEVADAIEPVRPSRTASKDGAEVPKTAEDRLPAEDADRVGSEVNAEKKAEEKVEEQAQEDRLPAEDADRVGSEVNAEKKAEEKVEEQAQEDRLPAEDADRVGSEVNAEKKAEEKVEEQAQEETPPEDPVKLEVTRIEAESASLAQEISELTSANTALREELEYCQSLVKKAPRNDLLKKAKKDTNKTKTRSRKAEGRRLASDPHGCNLKVRMVSAN